MTDQITLPEGIPVLTQYYIYMTEGCNLACRHCWLSPVYQPNGTTGGHLDFELFKLAVEEAIPLGLKSLKLTGGEPLLHPDFLRFIDFINEKNLDLVIETNCTLMTPEIAAHLHEKSTLGFISTSLDGAKPQTHDAFRGVPGSYQKTVEGIKTLVKVGFHPQVIMSIHSGNVDEIEDLIRLSEDLGAESVKFNLIQPAGRGGMMTERGQVLDVNKLIELGKWIEYDLQKKVKIRLDYSWPMIFFSLNRLINFGGDSCGIFNILGILPDGSLAMCGIGMAIPELVYGQLGQDHVADVWQNHPVLKDLRKILPEKIEGVCARCLFKNQCLGSCVAENFLQTQRLTAPFWFCKQAEESGLIPSQRTREEIVIIK